MKYNTNGSSLIYVMFLINIAIIVWLVVFNSSFILSNDVDIGNNAEEVFASVYDKWHIAIESVKKYNSNSWFNDGISCPQDVTMTEDGDDWFGWTTRVETTWISTSLVSVLWSLYCVWDYNGEEFRIYFNVDSNDFESAYYDGRLINLQLSWGSNIYTSTINIAPSSTIESYTWINDPWYLPSRMHDQSYQFGHEYTSRYDSSTRLNPSITFDLWSDRSIAEVKMFNNNYDYYPSSYLSWDAIKLLDSSNNIIAASTFPYSRYQYELTLDFAYRWLTDDVRYIRYQANNRYTYLREIEFYELLSSGSEEVWEWVTDFWDTPNTTIKFSSDGVSGTDGIDDDLNSDDYRAGSWDNAYANGHQDDDVLPRKVIFWSIPASVDYVNIFWNNYKTDEVIENNPNNDDVVENVGDILNLKMTSVLVDNYNYPVIFLDTFSRDIQNFDIKIIEFDRVKYRDEYTLLPIASYEGKNISRYDGYIHLQPDGSLSLEDYVDRDDVFRFDFPSKDYAIFLSNHSNTELAYKIYGYYVDSSYTPDISNPSSTLPIPLYINPIDDSGTDIRVTANHIISWWEKNFVWENLEIIGEKP